MKYRNLDNVVELSLEELCEAAGATSLFGAEPNASFFAENETLFPKNYVPKAKLCGTIQDNAACYELSGCADGIFCENDEWTVDVVRVADAKDFRRIKSDWKAYGQLLGFLLSTRERGRAVSLRLILVNQHDRSVRIVTHKASYDGLTACVRLMLSVIAFRTKILIDREKISRPSADIVAFPYPEIREGQEEMIRRTMTAIRHGKKMFICAPTGIGKTVSALYPAVRAFGAGLCDKIFYLTAKTSTSLEAYRAANKLFCTGANLKTIVLGSKESMCANQRGCGKYCNAVDCAYLRNAEKRMKDALQELILKQNGFYASVIRETAAHHSVCPYELSLDLSELCDIIICDYNYLFDPMVHLKRYFDTAGRFGNYVFLIDEAHNLVDRARAMFTASFSQRRIEEVYAKIPTENITLIQIFEPFFHVVGNLKKRCVQNRQMQADGSTAGYYIGQQRAEDFDNALSAFSEKIGVWLRGNRENELYDMLYELFRETQRYAQILARYDEKFITYIEETADDTVVSLICIDPSDVVGEALNKASASVLFSATLTPLSYFSDLLGGGKKSMFLELESPYESENLCVAAVDSISTRFEDREKLYKKTATYIAAAVSAKAGNYMVYFPSYGYLEKVHEAFCKKYPDVCTILQKRGLRAWEKEEFLASFPEDTGKMRIGFCVLGGSFSEGVDLPGSRLIGSIIVGVGLPGFSSERNIMRDYFENRYQDGFAYAYTYPGMNHVLQAAGRVIRREEDRGIVVLIDDRYATPTYQKLFPKHWKSLKYAGNSASLAEIVRKFWEKSK